MSDLLKIKVMLFFSLLCASSSQQTTEERSLDLSSYVPEEIEAYVFTVKGDISGTTVFQTAVPVWEIENEVSKYQVSQVQVGSTVTPTSIKRFKGVLYHGIPLQKPESNTDVPTFGWIEGYYLKATKR